MVFLSLGRLFENDTLRTPDNNALKNVSYSGRKVVAWATEEKPECLKLVKNVKNSENCKFVSVLTTGIVASITKFLTKVIPKTLYNYEKLYSPYCNLQNNFPVPKDMTTVTPVLIDFPTLDSTKPVPLENKLTVAIFNIPSIHKSTSMLSALKSVNKAINKQVKYSDLLVSIFHHHHFNSFFINLIDVAGKILSQIRHGMYANSISERCIRVQQSNFLIYQCTRWFRNQNLGRVRVGESGTLSSSD